MTKPLADVYHLDIYGLRKDKYQTLLDNSINTLPWQKIECRAPAYFFVAKDFGVYGQYEQGFSVSELFPVNSSGIKTHRDDFVVDMDKNTLIKRIESFYSSSATNKDLQSKLALNEKEEWIDAKRRGIFNKYNIKQIHYRPFDNRFIYYSSELIERGREKVMKHFLKGENVGLLVTRQLSTFDFQHIFVTKNIIDGNMISLQTKEYGYAFPLYLYPETTSQQSLQETSVRQPNLNPTIVQQIAEKLGLTFTPEKSTVIPAGMRVSSDRDVNVSNPWTLDSGNPYRNDVPLEYVQIGEIREPRNQAITPASFAPIDLLDYIYAILHSPNYRDTYKEFLKTDFPRVPYPDPHTFWQLVKLGGELRQLHLLECPAVNNPITTYPVDGDNTVTRKINQHDFTVHGSTSSPRTDEMDNFTVRPEPVEGRTSAVHPSTTEGSAFGASSGRTAEDTSGTETCGKVWINDTQYFDGVPKIAWEFYIGGYQPAQKWLKDRHGRTLSFEDILHYQKIIVALSETHRIMQEIDAI